MDIRDAYAERRRYEARLTEAGFNVTGGGGFIVGPSAGQWDIFIEDPSDPEREVCLSGAEAVEAYLVKPR